MGLIFIRVVGYQSIRAKGVEVGSRVQKTMGMTERALESQLQKVTAHFISPGARDIRIPRVTGRKG